MEFAILGPLLVRADGTDITPAAAKPRALLARLLVDANHSIPAERLVDDLWEGDPPPSAAATLQGYVSQLRKVVGADRLVSRAGGYQLTVDAGELDVDRFEAEVAEGRRLLAAGDAEGAVTHLTAAIGRWRGAALVDSVGAAWATAHVARLEEARLGAVESFLEARLARGEHAGVVSDAEGAVAEHPLRERLWAILMTALYRDGRQADALRAFQRVRRILADELGIEPSRELVELEAQMVRQEPALTPRAPTLPPPAARADHAFTFLFTDLESSTRMWEEHGDAMSGALAQHDELVRTAIETNGGRIVKTTGDGTHAVFMSAESAVRAACSAQRALEAAAWGATGPLLARMAVHTGAAEERDGDYYGPSVNRAARLMAIAHGGQSLASQATAAMVRDVREIELLDLGEHRLRDLSRPERVFQIAAPDLRADFPPLRSLDRVRTNLPVQLTSFVGRTDELQRLHELVAEHRVVTITGVGGVGKTRFALQGAAEIAGDFADGAWYCELAPATDEESMLGAVAATFGVPVRMGMTLEDGVVEFLRHKELLWILDNCEHLLDPAAQLVDRVLRSSERVRVLATSREALDVDGERPMRLRSLATATSDSLEAVTDCDAVKLFLDRSTVGGEEFALTQANAGTVNTICRRLDGIPLAIELAAVRVVSMSPEEIAARLDERFRLLTGGRRVALERHQTLRAAVEWSYALLDDRERAVFERLAVFAGGFDETAARAVVTDDDVADWDVIDALDGLVRKSLVVAGEQRAGRTRYEMLETLRQYAQERLDESAESDRWRRRHATFFAELSVQLSEGMQGPDEYMWRERRAPDLDNLRAAISWAVDSNDVQLVKSLVLISFEESVVGSQALGNPATRALAMAPLFDPADRGMLFSIAALEAYGTGDMAAARGLVADAWGLVREMDNATPLAVMLWNGFTPDFVPDEQREHALPLLEGPEGLETQGWSHASQARAYTSFAPYLIQIARDNERARRLVDRGYEQAMRSGNPSSIASALFARATLLARDDPDGALEALEQCIRLADEGAALATRGGALYIGALILARRGDTREALERSREAVEFLWARGRSPELDGGFGYTLETLDLIGAREETAVLFGAVLGGALQNLREMPVPPDRAIPSVRAVRDGIGRERFDACVAEGAAMSYDELVAWLLASLDALIATRQE